MDLSRFSWRRLFRFRVRRGPGTIGGGEGGRESEGRDQGGPSLSDAQRHLMSRADWICGWWWKNRSAPALLREDARSDLAWADRIVCRWNDDHTPSLDDLWTARDIYDFHGKPDNAEAVLWHIRSLLDARSRPTSQPAAAGPNAHAWDPPCSGTVPVSDPGPVSPGSAAQKHRTTPEDRGSDVW